MPISSLTLANYAPMANAELAFEVSTGSVETDPTTGNPIQLTTVLEYLAALTLTGPNWQGQAGVDATTYSCTGRLLTPAVLDPRITNGSQAEARINGYRGRFELVFDLSMNRGAYRDIRQSISGTFRVIGGPN